MTYIYDGALAPDTLRSIADMMKDYPHPIEMKEWPVLDFLPTHEYAERSSWGGPSSLRKSKLYGVVLKYFNERSGHVFLFCCTAEEKQMVIDNLPDLVFNVAPFKSTI
jgi:hypothetical protein